MAVSLSRALGRVGSSEFFGDILKNLGEFCDQGTCAICILDCGGKDCGDDGCGGSCGTCDSGFACDALNSLCCTPDTDLDSVCDVDDCAPDDNGSYQVPDEVLNVPPHSEHMPPERNVEGG